MNRPFSQQREVKFITIGPKYVGKTSLLYRFCEQKELMSPKVTYGVDFKWRTVEVGDNNEPVRVGVWDTAGQENYRSLAHSYYRQAHGVFLVYDLTSEESLAELEPFVEDMRNHCPPGCPAVLVGNKSDLPRVVSKEKSEGFQRRYAIPFYYETSAKDGTNVDRAFLALTYHCCNSMQTSRFLDKKCEFKGCGADAKYTCRTCLRNFCPVCQLEPHDEREPGNIHRVYDEISSSDINAAIPVRFSNSQQPRRQELPKKKRRFPC